MKIILASASPRRLEILQRIGLDPLVAVSRVKEIQHPGETVQDFLQRITRLKGLSVTVPEYEKTLLISADTIVLHKDKILGKPRDRREAKEMINLLAGKMHEVWTGLYLRYREKDDYSVAKTRVFFDPLSDDEIEGYLDQNEFRDKAGAYGIQGYAGLFVTKVEGCYLNVVGFPLNLFYARLKKMFPDIKLF